MSTSVVQNYSTILTASTQSARQRLDMPVEAIVEECLTNIRRRSVSWASTVELYLRIVALATIKSPAWTFEHKAIVGHCISNLKACIPHGPSTDFVDFLKQDHDTPVETILELQKFGFKMQGDLHAGLLGYLDKIEELDQLLSKQFPELCIKGQFFYLYFMKKQFPQRFSQTSKEDSEPKRQKIDE